jgi:hypothetical protein
MASIILGMGVGLCSLSQAQIGGTGGGIGGVGGAIGGGGGVGAIPGASFESATDPSAIRVTEGFRLVPTITLGQRYDSNVFFVPEAVRSDREDFVTSASPQVRGLFVGNLISVNSRVGAVGQYYVKNNDLNNIGANAGVAVDASKLASQFWPGSRFTVSDVYIFTPEPPAFLTGDQDTQETNSLIRGFQAGRVSTQSNSVIVALAVPLSLTTDVTVQYMNNLTHFGESEVQQAGTLLNTTLHTYRVGLSSKISLQDRMTGSFLGTHANSGNAQSYTAYGGFVAWDHMFNEKMTLRSSAGVLQVNDSTRSATSNVAPNGSLTILWNDNRTSWRLSYNVGLTPSLQFVGRPILTQAFNFSVSQPTFIENLVAFGSLNYGRGNELGGGGSSSTEISYTSYSVSGGMSYRVTSKTFVSLIYTYARFDNAFGPQTFELDRNMVQLGLTQALY